MIADFQNSLSSSTGGMQIQLPMLDTSMLSAQELYDNEQLVLNENKLLEV